MTEVAKVAPRAAGPPRRMTRRSRPESDQLPTQAPIVFAFD
eukprot:CAMPEP_0182592412 /NCGR_PEP_ID=MMETSP1324-20130603/75889_1 /TAXON_ID=236786 /ORGANISM="Florenciella sp., Strain RCC1587" /LENGTH=40 /DNA_ID= /DNA_START= /DNA_END= /DNA_ORIENTATION=